LFGVCLAAAAAPPAGVSGMVTAGPS
jgi:hypothetical protein